MSNKKLLKLGIGLFCVLTLLSGCDTYRVRKRLWPRDQGFPEREIVFTIEEGVFGFINPDGSGLITRTVAPELYATVPTWSPDGKLISFRAEGLGSYSYFYGMRPRVISFEGETVGWCYDWGVGNGRVWVTSRGQLVLPLRLDEEKPERIVLADFRSCQVLSTLFEASTADGSEHLDSATLSVQGWLAVSRVFIEDYKRVGADVVVIDPDSGERRVVGHGLAPAWSRDGEWLTFTGSDGIYIVRKDGSQLRRVVEMDAVVAPYRKEEVGLWSIGMSIASWSPDGKWLVYDRLNSTGPASIYKVNVESGVETEIFQGGFYPDWRWDLSSTDE